MEKQLIKLDSPSQLAEFSKILKDFIVRQNLYTPIKMKTLNKKTNKYEEITKNYVNVEGWQFAGLSTGVLPIIKSVENLSDEQEIKYRAEVELRKGEQVVGYGVSVCSNKESKRRNADEYVIASMAQTRAIGKAYRNLFAYLMKMAGYESTPVEEIEEIELAAEKQISEEETNKPATVNQKELLLNLAKQKGVELGNIEKITNGEVIAKIKELSEMKVKKEEKEAK